MPSNPPSGANHEVRVLDFPFPSAVAIFDLPSLFAGKLHALLCREYVKGRDWYDFLWYVSRGISVNHSLLSSALFQTGFWAGQAVNADDAWCGKEVAAKIQALDFSKVREDVRRFLKPIELPLLELWSNDFFLGQSAKLFGRLN